MTTDTIIMMVAALVCAGAVSFLATPLVRVMAYKVGAVDVPNDSRRIHTHPVPRLGGFAIFLGFIVAALLFANIDRQIQGVLIGSVIIVIMGVIDDITPLPALLKFVIQIIAALVAVLHGVEIESIINPIFWSSKEFIHFGIWSVPISVIWIVAVTNSVNLIDGLDGLAVGVSTIAAVTMLLIAFIGMEWNIVIILAALVGGCLGFAPYNKNPAKIFMGDTGALFLGFILATMSIIGLFKYYAVITFVVPFIILGFPIFDTVSAVFRRLAHGKNPMEPDKKHFHHRLIDMGFTQKQAVSILYLISTLLGVAALVMSTQGEIRALIVVAAVIIIAAIVFYIRRCIPKGKREDGQGDSPKSPDKPDRPDKS